MWNFQARTIKDFRACQEFFNHVLDAHILAALAAQLGAKSWDELSDKFKNFNWRKGITKLQQQFGEAGQVYKWRTESVENRDLVHENAVLLLQHGMIYRRFSEALITGESGWVIHCLKYFTIWLQNGDKLASLPNYRQECLHLMCCFTHIWSSKFFAHWKDQCLVNLSGSAMGFMPCDQLGEYVVRENKDQINHNVTPPNDLFAWDIKARQVLVFKAARENMERTTGAVKHYQHSSTVDSSVDIRTITMRLLQDKVFIRNPGRRNYSGQGESMVTSSIDLFGLGCANVLSGQFIEAYKDKMRRNREDEVQELEEEALDPHEHEI